MSDFIPTNGRALKTWIADSSSNIAVSGAGAGLLAAQMTDLENRWRAMHRGINHKWPERTPASRAQPAWL